jgi:hypothetical protein
LTQYQGSKGYSATSDGGILLCQIYSQTQP